MGSLHRVTELQMVQPGLNLHVARPLSHALDLPPPWESSSAAGLGRNAPQVPALSLGPQGSREHRSLASGTGMCTGRTTCSSREAPDPPTLGELSCRPPPPHSPPPPGAGEEREFWILFWILFWIPEGAKERGWQPPRMLSFSSLLKNEIKVYKAQYSKQPGSHCENQ